MRRAHRCFRVVQARRRQCAKCTSYCQEATLPLSRSISMPGLRKIFKLTSQSTPSFLVASPLPRKMMFSSSQAERTMIGRVKRNTNLDQTSKK